MPLVSFVLYLLGPGKEPITTTITPRAHVLHMITVTLMIIISIV